jgi:hypothetical protein
MALKRKEWVMIAGTATVLAAAAVHYLMYASKVRQWEAMKEETDAALAKAMVVERVIEPSGAGGLESDRFERGFVVCSTSWGHWSIWICEPKQVTKLESEDGSGWFAWRRTLTEAQWQDLLGTAKNCGSEVGKAYVNRGVFDMATHTLFDSPEATGNPSILTYAVTKPRFGELRTKVAALADRQGQGMERAKIDAGMEQVIKEVSFAQLMSSMYQSGRENIDIGIPPG